MRAYIQLGKIGDIYSILPILQDDFKRTGEKSKLIVSRQYANYVAGLDWLEPVIFDGKWADMSGALRFAKTESPSVFAPQMHSDKYLPRREHPSFQLDQWARCERLKDWGKLPLEIARNPSAESALVKSTILFADKSESSPFLHADSLYAELVKEFPQHQVVRLSSVTCPHVTDLLVIYDAADLIITIDTMHLHLSAATKTPVIALATDTPSRWHGSAYHPRMRLHVRYGDYEMKLPLILHEARCVVAKKDVPAVRENRFFTEHAYNPSILKVGDGIWETYRFHPDQKSWRTEMMLMVTTGHKNMALVYNQIQPPKGYEDYSMEDGRLFMFNGHPHISVTIARSRFGNLSFDPCVTAFAKLNPDGTTENWIIPKFGKNDWNGTEKNWSFFEWGGRLFFSYQNHPDRIVCELDGSGKVVNQFKTPMPVCWYGQPRGGTMPLPFGDKWIVFFHANQRNAKSDHWWNYHIGAMIVEPQPPFKVISLSKLPILSGNELYSQHKFWKPRVAICYGAIADGDGWELSVGLNDSQCGLLKVKREDLNL